MRRVKQRRARAVLRRLVDLETIVGADDSVEQRRGRIVLDVAALEHRNDHHGGPTRR